MFFSFLVQSSKSSTQGRTSPAPSKEYETDGNDTFFDAFLGTGSSPKKKSSSSSPSSSPSPSRLNQKSNSKISSVPNRKNDSRDKNNTTQSAENSNYFKKQELFSSPTTSLEESLVDESFMTPNTSLDGRAIEEHSDEVNVLEASGNNEKMRNNNQENSVTDNSQLTSEELEIKNDTRNSVSLTHAQHDENIIKNITSDDNNDGTLNCIQSKNHESQQDSNSEEQNIYSTVNQNIETDPSRERLESEDCSHMELSLVELHKDEQDGVESTRLSVLNQINNTETEDVRNDSTLNTIPAELETVDPEVPTTVDENNVVDYLTSENKTCISQLPLPLETDIVEDVPTRDKNNDDNVISLRRSEDDASVDQLSCNDVDKETSAEDDVCISSANSHKNDGNTNQQDEVRFIFEIFHLYRFIMYLVRRLDNLVLNIR